jgi:hypothetical protein
LSLCPPLDVTDPETFIAGIAAVLAQYPDEVVAQAVDPRGIPRRLKALRSLAAIDEICAELYEPVERRLERERIAAQPKLLARPPRTPQEQAEIDAQVRHEAQGPASPAWT